MKFGRPVEEIIRERCSLRTYRNEPIDGAALAELERHMADDIPAPFGAGIRFDLVPAMDGGDAPARVGTYGIIKGAPAFIAGAMREGGMSLEDFGFRMERIVLAATAEGLGTCWLGGTFTRSGFSQRMSLEQGEVIPAVVAVGYATERRRVLDRVMRFGAGSDNRKPWDELFFDTGFDRPLARDAAGPYAAVLDMVRLATSASNKQPWRVVREEGGRHFHLYMQRTKNYRERWSITGMSDLQRVDMGIAMCHFEAAACGAGLAGAWAVRDPGLPVPDSLCEYTATWEEE